jgi:RNase P subunit RPR2
MKCWHCDTELIWGGDHDIEEENDQFCMVTNLSCPNCGTYVEVYLPTVPTDELGKKKIETAND